MLYCSDKGFTYALGSGAAPGAMYDSAGRNMTLKESDAWRVGCSVLRLRAVGVLCDECLSFVSTGSAKGKMVYVEEKEHVSQALEGWEDFIMA